MKMLLKPLMAFGLLLSTTILYPIAYQAKAYTNTDTNQLLICLWDRHNDSQDQTATKQQAKDLIAAAQQLGAHITIEDIMTVPTQKYLDWGWTKAKTDQLTAISGDMQPSSKPLSYQVKFVPADGSLRPEDHMAMEWQTCYGYSPLMNFEKECHANGISVYNAECRHNYNASITGYPVTVMDVINANDSVIYHSKPSNNAPASVQAFYTKIVDSFNSNQVTELFREEMAKNPECKVPDLSTNEHPLEVFHCYDWELLNLDIVKSIENNESQKVHILYFGGDHIDAIVPLLPDLHYQEIASFGQEAWVSSDRSQAIVPVLALDDVCNQIQEIHTGDQVNATDKPITSLPAYSFKHYAPMIVRFIPVLAA